MAAGRTAGAHGDLPGVGDPALADFPAQAPGTRRWCFADQLGPHFLDAPGQPVLLVESRGVFRRRRGAHLGARPIRCPRPARP